MSGGDGMGCAASFTFIFGVALIMGCFMENGENKIGAFFGGLGFLAIAFIIVMGGFRQSK